MDAPCRREFRPRPWLLLLLLFPAAGCQLRREPAMDRASSSPGAQGREEVGVPAGEAPEAPPSLADARARAEAGDPNAALNLLDAMPEAAREDPAWWRLYGRCSLDLARQLRAAGTPSNVPFLLEDASRAFREALDREPDDAAALLGLAESRLEAGDAPGAWEAAARWLETAGDGGDPAGLLVAGRAGLALTVAEVQAGRPVPAAARPAEEALRRALDAGEDAAVVPLADLLAWAGDRPAARKVLVEALGGQPDRLEWIQRLQNLDADDPGLLVADLETVRAAAPGNATILWYLGEALYRRQAAARRQQDFPTAYEALDRAERAFLDSMARNPAYAATCRQWLHLVRTARGWALREEGRIRDAAGAFAAALEADPDLLEEKPDPGTLSLGIYTVVADFLREGLHAEAVDFLRRVCAVHPGNADWWNNYGFACRELGVARQEAGREEEARQLFEESWTAYTRAVELAPEDPRLVNDRALIAVYYLDHDLDLAEQELHRAIRLGTEQLARLPADVSAGKRQDLESAVGDAWENLAYLDLVRRQRTDRAERYLAESVRYYPYEQRDGVQRLRQVLARLRAGTKPPGEGADSRP